MSAQHRAEFAKMVGKYCRTYGLEESLTRTGDVWNKVLGTWEWSVWCPSRPELPTWGMGADDQDWEDGPNRPRHPIGSDKAKFKLVSRRKW